MYGYDAPDHNQGSPEDAEDHLKAVSTAAASLVVVIVVFKAVAGLALFEASRGLFHLLSRRL